MNGLIQELQQDALDKSVAVSDLLRKAFVVSRKLDIDEMEEWIGHELSGYPDGKVRPEYRRVTGVLRVWNPYHGWQPLHMPDDESARNLSSAPLGQSVAELESLMADRKGSLRLQLPAGLTRMLMEAMEVPLEPSIHISPADIVGILDAVRNNVLLWSLELEKRGIVGSGLTFSREEKQMATQVTYQVTNHIGSMHNSQLQQSNSGNQSLDVRQGFAELTEVLEQLKANIDSYGLRQEEKEEILADAESISAQVRSPNPKLGILGQALKSVRAVLEGATGNLLASDIAVRLAKVAAGLGLG